MNLSAFTLLVVFVFSFLSRGFSEEIIITSLADSGTGTLREALLSAENDDYFLFDPTLSGTIVLQSSLPQIVTSISIVGPPTTLVVGEDEFVFDPNLFGTTNLQNSLTQSTVSNNAVVDPQSNEVIINGSSLYQIFNLAAGRSTISNLQLVDGQETLGGAVLVQPNAGVFLDNVSIKHSNVNNIANPVFVDTGGSLKLNELDIINPIKGAGKDFLCVFGSEVILDVEQTQPQIMLEGAGALVKQGSNMVELTSTSLVGYQFIIQEGILSFNGSTSEPIYVQKNGTLQGTHSCLYIVNNGVVKPGNSIGTISIVGDYIQTGELQIELEPPSTSDLVQVGGIAFLDGTLTVIPSFNGLYLKGDTYAFLTAAGGITGTFQHAASLATGLNFGINYQPNFAQIRVNRNMLSFNAVELIGNTRRVADVFETADIVRGSTLAFIIANFNASESLIDALDQLDPDVYGALPWSNATTLYEIGELVSFQQFSFCDMPCCRTSEYPCCCPPQEPNRIWVSGIGEKTDQDTAGQLVGFRTYTGGALIGYDRRFDSSITAGLYGGYTYSHLTWKENQDGRTNINGYYLGLYGTFCWRRLMMDASILQSYYQYDVTREIDFASIHSEAKSSPQGYGIMAHFGSMLYFPVRITNFFPFVKMDYIGVWHNHIREHGAGVLDLSIHSNWMGFLHVDAGVLMNREYCYSWGMFSPAIAFSWVMLVPVSGTHFEAKFVSIPAIMDIQTTKRSFNAFSPFAALNFIIGDDWWLSATYKGEFGKNRREQDLSLTVRWQF